MIERVIRAGPGVSVLFIGPVLMITLLFFGQVFPISLGNMSQVKF